VNEGDIASRKRREIRARRFLGNLHIRYVQALQGLEATQLVKEEGLMADRLASRHESGLVSRVAIIHLETTYAVSRIELRQDRHDVPRVLDLDVVRQVRHVETPVVRVEDRGHMLHVQCNIHTDGSVVLYQQFVHSLARLTQSENIAEVEVCVIEQGHDMAKMIAHLPNCSKSKTWIMVTFSF